MSVKRSLADDVAALAKHDFLHRQVEESVDPRVAYRWYDNGYKDALRRVSYVVGIGEHVIDKARVVLALRKQRIVSDEALDELAVAVENYDMLFKSEED